MTADEIIAKVDEALQDDSISPVLSDVNDAVSFVESQAFLPSLVTNSAVKFVSMAATITDATNASPIVVTTSTDHGLSTGDIVVIVGVAGNTAANGEWYIEVLTNDTLGLLTSAGNGAYASDGELTKRDAYVDMPENYSHDLFRAFSVSQDTELNIRSNLRTLSGLHDAQSMMKGEVIEDVAVEHDKLYGLPIGQADDVIMCKYYRKPAAMTLGTDIPACIPEHLHEAILVKYILSKKWPLIEDGLDGASANTDRVINEFNSGIASLQAYYPRPSISQPTIERHLQFF